MTSLRFTTFVNTTLYQDTLKAKGGTTALFSLSARVLGTSFAALVYLAFKYLKHLASVDIKWQSSLAIQHTQLNPHLDE